MTKRYKVQLDASNEDWLHGKKKTPKGKKEGSLRRSLIRLAHENPRLRPALLPLFQKVAVEVVIPWKRVLELERELKRSIKRYKRYEGGTSSSPAGPDTTKFRATHSGFIEVGKYGPSGGLLIGIKVGANFYPNPHNIIDEYPEWKRENVKRDALLERIKRDVDRILMPFLEESGLNRVYRSLEWNSGSNYSTYGVPYQRWMKIV